MLNLRDRFMRHERALEDEGRLKKPGKRRRSVKTPLYKLAHKAYLKQLDRDYAKLASRLFT